MENNQQQEDIYGRDNKGTYKVGNRKSKESIYKVHCKKDQQTAEDKGI